jgi:hypothetical protein
MAVEEHGGARGEAGGGVIDLTFMQVPRLGHPLDAGYCH